jgi:hypothetical protein
MKRQILLLLVLAPVCAEYLAAYLDSTGDASALLWGLLIFVPLYGAPALIIREVTRRQRLGWIGMILMAAAFGLLQAGVVDQSLFSESYQGIESWERTRRAAFIAPLGIGLHNTQLFIGGHIIYSICAPIALSEGMQPATKNEPWLGRVGLAVTTSLYAAASIFILVDHQKTESSHASTSQVIGSLFIIVALIVAAFVLGRRSRAPTERRAPRPIVVFVASLIGVAMMTGAPENWPGALFAVTVLGAGGLALARVSVRPDWSIRHHVAVAAGAVISRGVLAFTYFPVMGEVPATRKYAHNIVLLAIVVTVSLVAAQRARRAGI